MCVCCYSPSPRWMSLSLTAFASMWWASGPWSTERDSFPGSYTPQKCSFCSQSNGGSREISLVFFFNLADIKPPMEESMAHTGLLSLGSLVLRIMARPQTAFVRLPCVHSEDSKANNEPTYSSQGPFYTPKFWASAAWQISVHEFQFSPLGSALFVHKNVLYSFPPNPTSIILNRKKSRLQNCFNTGSVIM